MEQSYRRDRVPLRRWLQSRFPRAGHALLDDAVADAYLDALAHPRPFLRAWQRGGPSALRSFLRTVAWRHLRGYYRKKSTRCELTGADNPEPPEPTTPFHILAGREAAARLATFVDQAAQRHGGSRPEALLAALWTRLEGATDTEAARLHDVPREYVNRARRWLEARIRHS